MRMRTPLLRGGSSPQISPTRSLQISLDLPPHISRSPPFSTLPHPFPPFSTLLHPSPPSSPFPTLPHPSPPFLTQVAKEARSVWERKLGERPGSSSGGWCSSGSGGGGGTAVPGEWLIASAAEIWHESEALFRAVEPHHPRGALPLVDAMVQPIGDEADGHGIKVAHLPTSAHICPHLPTSAHISPCLPMSPHVSPRLPISPHIQGPFSLSLPHSLPISGHPTLCAIPATPPPCALPATPPPCAIR